MLPGSWCLHPELSFGLPHNQCPYVSASQRIHGYPLSTTGSTLGSGLCQDCMGALEDIVEKTSALEIPGVLSSFNYT